VVGIAVTACVAQVAKWRSKNPYIVVVVRRDDDQWVLELPTGATLVAPIRFDNDGDPVFSLPKAELLAHVALRDCDPTDMDFRILSNDSFEIDLGNVVIDRH
jgi:hypothetical protein